MSIVDELLSYIKKYIIATDTKSKKNADLVAILAIVFVLNTIFLVTVIFNNVDLPYFPPLKRIFSMSQQEWEVFQYQFLFDVEQTSISNFNKDFFLFLKMSIYMVICFGIAVFSRKLNIAKRIIVCALISYVMLLVINVNMIFGIAAGISVISFIIIFIPIGSLQYLSFVMYLLLGIKLYIIERESIINDHRINKPKAILLIICFFVTLLSLTKIFENLGLSMIFLMLVSLVLLLWMNNVQNVTIKLFRKLFVYLIFVPFIIINNNQVDLPNIIKTISIFITIFFCLERVIGILKDIGKQIKEKESLLLN